MLAPLGNEVIPIKVAPDIVGLVFITKVDPVPVCEVTKVALPTEVIGPVKFALVVTVPAVKPEAVPVMFVPTRIDGVPRLGVTRVGEVARTTDPLPVVVAALIAVPLPCRIPVMEVEMVIAGVEVAVATVPAKPLADTTETEVTVPEVAGAAHTGSPPDTVSTLPVDPIGSLAATGVEFS